VRSVQLITSDEVELDADIADAAGDQLGRVVVCHPHPLYGGDRHNVVVEALFAALPRAGFTTLRFDFRRGDGDGVAERLDVIAALDRLETEAGGPLLVAGYSFGAAVALGTDDPRIAAIAAIAPPLTMMQVDPPGVTTLVLTPRHDQFTPPDDAGPIVADWAQAEFDVIESADHFLAGHASAVAARVTEWLTAFVVR